MMVIDGSEKIKRKRNRIEGFFLTGISKSVTETNVLAYLEKQNVNIFIFKVVNRVPIPLKLISQQPSPGWWLQKFFFQSKP